MSKNDEKVTGGCLCGAVRYELDRPPYNVGYCHCGMCRKAMGNLFSTWVITKKADLRYVTGEPDWYQSSASVRRGFCGTCGSPIVFDPMAKDFVPIWIGSLDDPTAFEPRAHWHTEDKIPWVDIHANLPHDLSPTQPPEQ